MIQALYDIETRTKEMTWQQREELRARESRLLLAGIKKWLDSPVMKNVLPKSDFAEAIREYRQEERRERTQRKQYQAARRRLARRRNRLR